MNNTFKKLASHKHILMLQGPIGPFFSYLSARLQEKACQVYKINFNAGDSFFYHDHNTTAYRLSPEAWTDYLTTYLEAHNIQAIVLFGEWRKMHQVAITLAKQKQIAVYVFEEGYIRPDYITLEPLGVNANSPMPRCATHYQAINTTEPDNPKPVKHRFWRIASYAIGYYSMAVLCHWCYPHYQHHRPMNLLTESMAWIKSGWRKWYFDRKEADTLARLYHPSMKKQYFLVALQVHNDSQVLYHSTYDSIEEMISSVIASFAQHAFDHITLVFKHHPMDRGYKDYSALISQLRQRYQLGNRLIYIHDGHLPNLLKNAKGVVTINSTVGLSALYHHTPLKILGEAIYDIEGLVSSCTLDAFWTENLKVNQKLYANFRHELIERTQFNLGFYTPSSFDNLIDYL